MISTSTVRSSLPRWHLRKVQLRALFAHVHRAQTCVLAVFKVKFVAAEDIESKYADDALDQEKQLTVGPANALLQPSVW